MHSHRSVNKEYRWLNKTNYRIGPFVPESVNQTFDEIIVQSKTAE